MGVPAPEWCEPLARALQLLGLKRALVVCGEAGTGADGRPLYLDELSTLGTTTLAAFAGTGPVTLSRLSPAELPIAAPGTLKDLVGGDAVQNAAILRRIFTGEETGPKRDAVLLNAGAALFVANQVRSITDGWHRAAEVIDRGDARRKLEALAGASR
jgi:anthranilate phosphoribosyltransferase